MELDISIFNTLGQLSGRMYLQADKGINNLLLPTSELPKGMYAVHIRSDAGVSDIQQLVVK